MSFTGIGIVQMILFHLLSLTWSSPRKAYEDKYKLVKMSSLPKLRGIKKAISLAQDIFFFEHFYIFKQEAIFYKSYHFFFF